MGLGSGRGRNEHDPSVKVAVGGRRGVGESELTVGRNENVGRGWDLPCVHE